MVADRREASRPAVPKVPAEGIQGSAVVEKAHPRTGKAPRKWELARDVGVTAKVLSGSKLWPVFYKEYKAAKRRHELSPVGCLQARKRESGKQGNRLPRRSGQPLGEATKTQRCCQARWGHCVRTVHQLSDVHCWRRGLQAKGVRSDRLQNRPTGNEQRAIAFLKSQIDTTGRLPLVQDILRAAGIKSATTLWRWDDFRREYREAKAELVKATPWGKPLNFREGEAIFRLQQTVKAIGQVPPIDDLAESLGVTVQGLNLYKTLRRAMSHSQVKSSRKPTRPPATASTRPQWTRRTATLATPRMATVPESANGNEGRGKWLYDEWKAGTKWERIKERLAKRPEFDPIESIPGIKAAIKRHAKRHDLPFSPRAPGRPIG